MQKRILLVEDRPDRAGGPALQLEAGGYDMVIASAGSETLREMERFRPHLLLVDIARTSPGLEVAQVLGRVSSRPCVLLTEEPVTTGPSIPSMPCVTSILNRPYSREKLLETVRRALDGWTGDTSGVGGPADGGVSRAAIQNGPPIAYRRG
ncbi:MAG TPA: hypothetical protein VI337_01920 [Nitrospirales bacterium]|nr:hypothetical protein [Nitrospirales bacterium]